MLVDTVEADQPAFLMNNIVCQHVWRFLDTVFVVRTVPRVCREWGRLLRDDMTVRLGLFARFVVPTTLRFSGLDTWRYLRHTRLFSAMGDVLHTVVADGLQYSETVSVILGGLLNAPAPLLSLVSLQRIQWFEIDRLFVLLDRRAERQCRVPVVDLTASLVVPEFAHLTAPLAFETIMLDPAEDRRLRMAEHNKRLNARALVRQWASSRAGWRPEVRGI